MYWKKLLIRGNLLECADVLALIKAVLELIIESLTAVVI